MSESCCGDVAIEALVTVCRAMSQLEVGNLAVASYGKEGNIRLLHDFDQSFTGEAGIKVRTLKTIMIIFSCMSTEKRVSDFFFQSSVFHTLFIPFLEMCSLILLWLIWLEQMISNLTFKQENTIKDEPVVDLLKYLNNMLDTAVANARLPSGQNPLQQLVLIIADGRFIEKVPSCLTFNINFDQNTNLLTWCHHPRTYSTSFLINDRRTWSAALGMSWVESVWSHFCF